MVDCDARVARRTANERRETLLGVARALFVQQGFHNTGMAQIARESGVLVGQIYRDFASKEDLIAAIAERDITDLLDDAALCSAAAAGDTRRLREWIAGKSDACSSRLYADILSEATRNARAAEILRSTQDRLRARLDAALEVLAPGAARTAARARLGDLIFVAAGGVLHRQICSGSEGHQPVVDDLLALVNARIDALQALPAEAGESA